MQKNINYNLLHPSYKELWDLVGEDNMLKIHDDFRGTQLQLPMRLYDPDKVEKYLHDNMNEHYDVRELSNMFDFSPRWIKNHMK